MELDFFCHALPVQITNYCARQDWPPRRNLIIRWPCQTDQHSQASYSAILPRTDHHGRFLSTLSRQSVPSQLSIHPQDWGDIFRLTSQTFRGNSNRGRPVQTVSSPPLVYRMGVISYWKTLTCLCRSFTLLSRVWTSFNILLDFPLQECLSSLPACGPGRRPWSVLIAFRVRIPTAINGNRILSCQKCYTVVPIPKTYSGHDCEDIMLPPTNQSIEC